MNNWDYGESLNDMDIIQSHVYDTYYMKYGSTKYIFEIDVYDLKKENKEFIVPHFYKILNIYDMTTNESIDEGNAI